MKSIFSPRFKPAKLIEISDEIPNPERGWYQIHTFKLGDDITMEDREYTLNGTDTIAFVLIDISAYKNSPIDKKGMEQINMIFQFFKDYRLDMIVRVVYDTVGRCMENEPDSAEKVIKHMRQIGPSLRKFAGEIFVYQGLFIGNWGEMHSSKFLTPSRLRLLSTEIMKQLEDTAYLAVRRPAYVRILFPEGEDMHQEKVCIFDDAIMASSTHMGTFGDMPDRSLRREMSWLPSEELRYVAELCDKVPYGGEALWEDKEDELKNIRHSLPETVKYFGALHLSYLNRIHDVRFIDNLKNMTWNGNDVFKGLNGYDYVGRHLGYRFVVKKIKCSKLKTDKSMFRWDISIANVGFSRCFFDAEVFLKGKDQYGKDKEINISDWIELRKIASNEKHDFVCMTEPIYGPVYLSARKKATKQAVYFANKRDEKTVDSSLLIGTIK